MLKLVIDNRETELKEYFEKKEVIEFSNLDLGDLQVFYKNELVAVIERKNITDLAKSIKDGRYREQKLRLLNNFDVNKIFYLIEGNIRKGKIASIPHTTLVGSMINAMFRDNIKIIRTNNISETIEFIELLLKKLSKEPDKLLNNNNKADNPKKPSLEYVSSIKLKKKDNMNEDNCFLLQLSQIPGVSLNIANAIKKNYNSMFELCKKYNLNENETDNKKLLLDIKYDIANDKQRKIGKVVSERIYNYLSFVEKK